jgi:RHH-type proline utilization regulon transcriptional repressor/proline dehydrogenase/delta 1-pyrroline-5-carboxylate dehydrogenase
VVPEADVRALARRIAEAGARDRARLYHLSFWTDRLLQWAMEHPEFRTQLFRFVDVFPACTDDADVVRHVEEYFAGIELPTSLDIGMEAAEHIPFGAKIEAAVTRRNIRRMAKQFIAGESPGQALPRLRELWRSGEAATVDLLGEKTITTDEADSYAARVHELLDVLSKDATQWPEDAHLERDPWGVVPKVNVSVKPTALAPRYAPLTFEIGLNEATKKMLEICEHARGVGAAVYLDMESYDAKDLTLELIRRVGETFRDGPPLGAVIQAYTKESYDDIGSLIEWARRTMQIPLNVRLVKGAYWDYETITSAAHGWPSPVFERKPQTDANYERCTRLLLDHAGIVRPAFATHNLRSIAYAVTAARELGLHETAIEIQLLYGMAEPIHAALRRLGMRVRAYAPIGELVPGMAYLVRRLLENTANESFLRQTYVEARDLDETIAAPDIADADLPRLHANGTREHTDPDDPGPFTNEPIAEFRRADVRERFASAVADVGVVNAPVVIDGARVATAGEIVSVDPSDPSVVVARAGRATASDADRAIEIAKRAQPDWSATPVRDRAAILFEAAAIMRRRRDELAALEVVEAGKPWAQADADVCEAIDFCEYYAREALRLDVRAPVHQAPGEHNTCRYEARGITAVISPWNFPLAIPCGMVTAPLVCGNAVLFKPAEQTPGIAFRLVEVLYEAGVPPEVLAFLPGIGEEVGAYVVDHSDVSTINFTGSKAVGLHIVERASVTHPGQRFVKRVIAEMGGKNAIVVDTDADLDVAVPAVVDSAFGYAGQKCSAAARVIGVGSIFDALVERLVGATKLIAVGSPRDMATVVGPLIDEDAFDRVHRYQALAEHVALRRDDVPSTGYFAGLMIAITDDPQSPIATEEIFGPVLVCLRAKDFDHAIELANVPPYALTGGVFSRSPSCIRRATSEIRAGNMYVNRSITGAMVGRQPFGGFGLSGVGSKAGGPDYLAQFCDPRVVTENTIRQGFAPPETNR